MSLFAPALRMSMLFLNVYDAYKTLKAPAPSLRDPTRPSVRASTQRKRDMKGCLAVWIVWCCFAAYERIVESFVSLFIPFYDEFKSMFMLFLILTRARGAEPIFLHILRPIVKPYTSTLDGTLEILRMVGDFVFALSSFPVHLALAWWHKRFGGGKHAEVDDSDSEATPSSSTHSSIGAAGAARSKLAPYEIWIPPPIEAYDDGNNEKQNASGDDVEMDSEAVDAPPEILELTAEEKAVEEWTRYPAFPSAYPASPITSHTFLPPPSAAAAAALAQYSAQPQSISARMYGASQEYQQSLGSSMMTLNGRGQPHARGFSGSSSALASAVHAYGMHQETSSSSATYTNGSTTLFQQSSSHEYGYDESTTMDEGQGHFIDEDEDDEGVHSDVYEHDALLSPEPPNSRALILSDDDLSHSEEEDEEEDIYNMTLRTPLPPHGAARSRALMARITIPLPMPLGSAASSLGASSTNVPSAQTTGTFRTWSQGGSGSSGSGAGSGSGGLPDEDSEMQEPGFGFVGGNGDGHGTIKGRRGVNGVNTVGGGGGKTKKRKAVTAGLQEISDETSDAASTGGGDDDQEEGEDDDVTMDAPEGEASGDDPGSAGVKRRRLGAKPAPGKPAPKTTVGANGNKTTTNGGAPQAKFVVRKPLAVRQSSSGGSAGGANTTEKKNPRPLSSASASAAAAAGAKKIQNQNGGGGAAAAGRLNGNSNSSGPGGVAGAGRGQGNGSVKRGGVSGRGAGMGNRNGNVGRGGGPAKAVAAGSSGGSVN